MKIIFAFTVALSVSILLAGESPLDVGTKGADIRLPIPEPAKVAELKKVILDLLKEDYAKAKTPADKAALAQKLLSQGIQTNDDPVGKYACLIEAQRLSTEAGTIETTHEVIAHIAEFFSVDAFALRRKALGDFISAAKDVEAQKALAALKILDGNMADPAANLNVGRYLCFNREMWDMGIPYLAASSDEKLKSLAEAEVVKPTDALAEADIGDGWWDIAAKEQEPKKGSIKRHAGVLYREAVLNLTGLTKVKVEKRIAELAAQPVPGKVGAIGGRKINLLALVDPTRDVVRGNWRMDGAKLVCEPGMCAVVQFPYKAPAEYDFKSVYIRQGGNGGITQLFPTDHGIMWNVSSWQNQIHAFDRCDGIEGLTNPSAVRTTSETVVVNGKQVESIVRVRKNYIECFINGKSIVKWDKGFERLQADSRWVLKDPASVGVGSNNSKVEYISVELIEISGAGAFTVTPNAKAVGKP